MNTFFIVVYEVNLFFCRRQRLGVGVHDRRHRRRQVEVRRQHQPQGQQPLLRQGRGGRPHRLDPRVHRFEPC